MAAEKKRKAKLDRDRRLNHRKEYYEWLNFTVYITTVDESTWSTEDIINAYRVRWQIEIIFKSWKSNMENRWIIRSRRPTHINEYPSKLAVRGREL